MANISQLKIEKLNKEYSIIYKIMNIPSNGASINLKLKLLLDYLNNFNYIFYKCSSLINSFNTSILFKLEATTINLFLVDVHSLNELIYFIYNLI